MGFSIHPAPVTRPDRRTAVSRCGQEAPVEDQDRTRLRPAWQAALGDTTDLVASVAGVASGSRDRRGVAETADALVADVWELAEGLAIAADHAAQHLPGYRATTSRLRRLESAVLRGFRRRLDESGEETPSAADGDSRVRLLNQLLEDSLHTDLGRSREELHLRILRQLVPDEARILAAVSDGTRYPLLHIEVRGTTGGSRVVLADACTVGRVAGVHLHSAVPGYIGHLRDLGVLEEGPKEDSLSDQYALLANEDYVMRAVESAQGGLRGTSEVRRTVHISPLGAELWAACRPGEGEAVTETTTVTYRSAYAGAPPLRDKQSVQTKSPS
jgi:hypothetical protein